MSGEYKSPRLKEGLPGNNREEAVRYWREKLERRFGNGEATESAGKETASELRELEEMSVRDWMTGAYNRAEIIRLANQAAAAGSIHTDRRLVVAILDLDNFSAMAKREAKPGLSRLDIEKQTDEALRHLVRVINGVRNKPSAGSEGEVMDRLELGRLGGEEFMLVLDGATEEEAEAALERIREEVLREMANEPGWPAEAGRLTASIGYAVVESDGVEAALCRADEALYSAKQNGKNRTERAESGEQPGVNSAGITWQDKGQTSEIESLRREQQLEEEIISEAGQAAAGGQLSAWINKIARRMEALDYLGASDALTGLMHRGAGEIALTQLLLHSQAFGDRLRLWVADIVSFKELNNTHGHDAGNRALAAAAKAVSNAELPQGLAGRMNCRWRPGGTFLVAGVEKSDTEDETGTAGKMKAGIENALKEWGVGADVAEVVAAGAKTPRELFTEIDRALSEAKRQRSGGQTSAG